MKKPPDPPRPFLQCLPPCPLQKPPLVLRLPLSYCFVSPLLSSPVTRKLHGPFLVPPGSPVFCSSSPAAILDLGCCSGTVGRHVCVVIRSSSGTTISALFRRINGGLHLAPWLIDDFPGFGAVFRGVDIRIQPFEMILTL
uniref:Uncharacterized protein n=1 Tax=Opuntia streptacantha TaxID=393608 RepID=A0A7C8YM52_OPUST